MVSLIVSDNRRDETMDGTDGRDDIVVAEAEVAGQLRLAETFFNHSVSCLVILDPDYNFVRVNAAYARACHRTVDEFAGKNHFELFPSDTKLIFDDVLRTRKPFVTFTRSFEFADQPERGITYWDWTLVPVLGAAGEIEYLVFSLVEVTERKRAEEALRIAALVYQHSSEAMMVTNVGNDVIAINPAFTKLTGYNPADIIGKNPQVLKSGKQAPEFYEEMWQSLNETGHWHGELWDVSKNGDAIAFRLTINSVYDEGGAVVQRVAQFSDVTEQKLADKLIWEQANIDMLTRLPNRHMFLNRLQEKMDAATRGGDMLVLLLVDLDQFKEINDAWGHSKGDILLVEAARRISACVGPAVTVARLGGDEFGVLLCGTQKTATVDQLAGELIAALVAPYDLGVAQGFVSASIGIAQFPAEGKTREELLSHVDQAMNAAKAGGRNRYRHFTSSLQAAVQSRLSMTNDLRLALVGNQFDVYYQPIITLASGRIDKAEALIRWRHPTRGLVGPDEFIALAEASGLILEIGQWVFRQAAEQVARQHTLERNSFQISVNVSPMQFRNDARLTDAWLSTLADLNLPMQSIVIEITEGLLLDLSPEVTDKLLAFCNAGAQVALDDFGTGYSSLAYLKKFDIDYIKIDRAFVYQLETDPNDRALCEAIIVMAHKLGLKVIAEGVETAAQRDFLKSANCDFAQGYLYSRPVAAPQFELLLREDHARS
ncbi:MAG: EAL domain-containing protein [Massilia sp.]